MPAISVIVPTHNRKNFLAEAIQSVLAQDFGDLELIVIDDGSSDGTEAMVRSIPDKRIIYLQQDHGERSRARNLGIQAAQGEYIAFLDDDDLYLSHKLAVQFDFLSKNADIDLVASGAQILDFKGKPLKTVRPWRNGQAPDLVECLSECRFLMGAVLCRRKALERMPYWFDPDLSLAEDFDFWVRLAYAECRMAWLPSVVYAYRTHHKDAASLSVGYALACIRILDSFFNRNDVPEPVHNQKEAIYAKRYLFSALRSYAVGLSAMGERFLGAACRLDPALTEETPPRLLQRIIDYACSDLMEEQERFIQMIFDHVPASLSHLAGFRQMALEAVTGLTPCE